MFGPPYPYLKDRVMRRPFPQIVSIMKQTIGMGVSPGQSHLQTLIEHWDGIHWSIVSTPYTSLPNNELIRITAVSANDIWAAGFSMPELDDPYTTNVGVNASNKSPLTEPLIIQ
jgi:hypothetical protein